VSELQRDRGFTVPPELEPHWTDTGTAFYWQKLEQEGAGEFVDEGGEGEGVEPQFELAGPFPANTPSQIILYIHEKKLRFRPNVNAGVVAVEDASLVGATEEPGDVYECLRHSRGDYFGFVTFRKYQRHCAHYQEDVLYEYPPEIKERIKGVKYYCPWHNVSYTDSSQATRHIQGKIKVQGQAKHPSLEDMSILEVFKCGVCIEIFDTKQKRDGHRGGAHKKELVQS
jgi:hypothetical protein